MEKKVIQMTANQLAYHANKEIERANRAKEDETERSNLAKETETRRSNLEKEKETHRSNVEKEKETSRHNKTSEAIESVKASAKVVDAFIPA